MENENQPKKSSNKLRSKIYVFVYNNVISIHALKDHLSKAFKIGSNASWNFIIRTENYIGHPSVLIAFLQFVKPTSIFLDKVNLEIEGKIEKPTISRFSNADLPLYSILKFTCSSDEQEYISNMNPDVIDKYLTKLFVPCRSKYPEKCHINSPKITINSLSNNLRKPITPKQLKTIRDYILEARQELDKAEPNASKLKKIKDRLRYYSKDSRTIETPPHFLRVIKSLLHNKK